ncbi:hypothetical protein [uncultured Nostoc sp.]|uniref:hypothetical protein n=1 Tax=uncultured Nostoc sp. TaxID=340711 RepID=UPI0035CADE53
MADNSSNSGSGKPSTNGNDAIEKFGQSPFGRLKEVIPEKDLPKIFSGVGNGESGGSPFGGGAAPGGSQPNLAYGGNPFAGDNFWNIFAGGVNPSKVGGNSPAVGGSNPPAGSGSQTSGSDPLTGAGASSSNPLAGSGKPSPSGSDPLTGTGQTYGISTSEIPNGFDLRVTIDKLVNSKVDKELGAGGSNPFGAGAGAGGGYGLGGGYVG